MHVLGSSAAWRYIATNSGAMRQYPGRQTYNNRSGMLSWQSENTVNSNHDDDDCDYDNDDEDEEMTMTIMITMTIAMATKLTMTLSW